MAPPPRRLGGRGAADHWDLAAGGADDDAAQAPLGAGGGVEVGEGADVEVEGAPFFIEVAVLSLLLLCRWRWGGVFEVDRLIACAPPPSTAPAKKTRNTFSLSLSLTRRG